MPRSRPIRSTFDAGEWSPEMAGRVELEKYTRAAAIIENFIVQTQGGILRRPGTKYVAPAKAVGYDPLLLPFEFGPDQSIVLEVGEGYSRFYTLGGQIVADVTTASVTNGDFSNGLTGWTNKSTGGGSIGTVGADVLVQGSVGTPTGNMTLGGGLAVPFGGIATSQGYRYHRLVLSGGDSSRGFEVAEVKFYEGTRDGIPQDRGTVIGNMTAGTYLYLDPNIPNPVIINVPIEDAFNGKTEKAGRTPRNASGDATIGKNWGSGITRIITGFELWGDRDDGLKAGILSDITVRLQGSTDNFGSSAVTLSTHVIKPVKGITHWAFFDDDQVTAWDVAARSSSNTGLIGKDWGPGHTKIITGFTVRGSNSDGFKKGENPLVTVTLQGSTDNFATAKSLASVKVTDKTGPIAATVHSSVEIGTGYRYHRLALQGGNSGIGFAVSQVQFYEQGSSTGRMRLMPGAGVASAEQLVTLPSNEIGKPHTLKFNVTSSHGGQAVVQIGTSSGDDDVLSERTLRAGSYSITFRPVGTANYLRFSTRGDDEIQIDNVRFIGYLGVQPYEVSLPYQRDDLEGLGFEQTGDVMWLVHARHEPRKLVRRDFANWDTGPISLMDGPYLDVNLNESIVITASAQSGQSVTLTCNASIWQAGHIGSSWRLCAKGGVPGCKTWAPATAVSTGEYRKWNDNLYRAVAGATTGNSPPIHDRGAVSDGVVDWSFINRAGWGFAVIIGFTNSKSVTAKIRKILDPSVVSDGTTVWREGAFSAVRGYPSVVAITGSRLFYAKGLDWYLSRVGLFDDFSPDGEDDDAIYGSIDAAIGSPITWAVDHERIVVGTSRGIFTIQSTSSDDPLTPKNVQVKQATAAGASPVTPVKVDNAIIYLSRSGRRAYELTPALDPSGASTYRSVNGSVLSSHILGDGANQLALTREAISAIWAMREDGQLATLTYSQAEQVVAWSRQVLGGNAASVRAITAIPGSNDDEKRDQLWMVVRRAISGGEVRYIEYMQPNIRAESVASDAWHVDAGVSYDGTKQTGLNVPAEASEVGAAGISFVTDDNLFVAGDVGRRIKALDGLAEITTYVSATEVQVEIIRAFTDAGSVAAGEWQLSAMTFSGLDHLEGETVLAWVDGGAHEPLSVLDGAVTLDVPGFAVTIGLPAPYRYESMKIVEGGTLGPTAGVLKRASRVFVGLVRSLECNIGLSEATETIIFRNVEDDVSKPPDLFTGEKAVQPTDPYSIDPRIIIAGDGAGPLHVTHVVINDLASEELS